MTDVTREGAEAGRILDNEVYQKAVAEAEAQIMKSWRMEEDPARREQMWHTMNAVKSVTDQLKKIRDRGVAETRRKERKTA